MRRSIVPTLVGLALVTIIIAATQPDKIAMTEATEICFNFTFGDGHLLMPGDSVTFVSDSNLDGLGFENATDNSVRNSSLCLSDEHNPEEMETIRNTAWTVKFDTTNAVEVANLDTVLQ